MDVKKAENMIAEKQAEIERRVSLVAYLHLSYSNLNFDDCLSFRTQMLPA